jgi:hypothetical protein
MLSKTPITTCPKFKLNYTQGIHSSKYSLLVTITWGKNWMYIYAIPGRNLCESIGEERRKKEKRNGDEKEE